MTETAVAPGSVTTVFVPQDDPDAGSLGVSFATADGVTATVEAAGETTVRLGGEPTSFEPVEGVLDRLGVTASVSLDTDVPVGRGFGASGAATLATALAADDEYGLGYDRDGLVTAAHRAEVAAGTGLGDVFVQARGGLVWNTGDGVGRAERRDRIEYASYGGVSTASVLGDERTMRTVVSAGRDALADFDPTAPLDEWFARSWSFASATGLATDRVTDAVARVRAAGGSGTMAMVGETVLAAGASGVFDDETRVAPEGARLR
jgi:pantoate kinase